MFLPNSSLFLRHEQEYVLIEFMDYTQSMQA